MKALSLWQPWAHLVAIGAKQYETRCWACNFTGPLAIHAAVNKSALAIAAQDPFKKHWPASGAGSSRSCPAGIEFGAIIAVAWLGACRNAEPVKQELLLAGNLDEVAFGDFSYTYARYAFRLTNVVKLPRPIYTRGYQRFWNLLDEDARFVTSQLPNGWPLKQMP